VNKLVKVKYSLNVSSKKETEILQSDYHIVIKPTKNNLDKHIIQDVVKQYANSGSFNIFKTKRSFKVIVIHNIDMLSSSSQAAMRRTMEKYASSCRFILSCEKPSMTWDSLRSRCITFSARPPTILEIEKIINHIIIKEDYPINPIEKKHILDNCHFNLKKAIWMLNCNMLKIDRLLPLDKMFEEVINDILTINKEKDLSKLLKRQIEVKVEQILIDNIEKTEVIEIILQMLISRIDNDEILKNIISCASEAELYLIKGRRDIIPISFFISGIIYEIVRHGYIPP
jgi:replication factor C subunit 3/5